ncbi:MAG: YlmC/YmxH family sporulation protein [Roseburia sp.]
MRFCELGEKQVINVADCCCIGTVIDLDIDERSGRVCALIVADTGRFCGFFRCAKDILVPWEKIVKIGPDIILVDVCLKPPKK